MKALTLNKVILYFTCLLLFVLPWQTRWMYAQAQVNGSYFEWGSQSLYGTELLLGVIIILLLISFFRNTELKNRIFSTAFFHSRKRIVWSLVLVSLFLTLQVALSVSPVISYNWVLHLIEAMCLALVIIVVAGSLSSPYEGEVGAAATGGVLARANDGWSNGKTPPEPPLPKRGTTSAMSLLTSLWLSAVVQGLFALYQFFTQSTFAFKWFGLASHSAGVLGDYAIEAGGGRWLRAYGSFGSPNILGGFLAVCWLFGLILYVRERNVTFKYILSTGQIIILSGLVLSFSRSAWLAAVAGCICLLFLRSTREKTPPPAPPLIGEGNRTASSLENGGGVYPPKSERRWAMQIAFSLITIFIFLFTLSQLFLARTLSEGRLESKSITERQSQYTQAFEIIREHPLWGVGPGAYTFELYKKNPTREAWDYQPVHNVFLLAWVETGIVGVGMLILLNCYIVKLLWKKNRIFLALLIPLFIISLFDHYFWSLYSGMIMCGAVFGLLLTANSDHFTIT